MTNTGSNEDHNKIKAVDSTLDIICTLTEEGPLTITEVASALDRSPSNVLAHLRTLQERGFVVEEDNRYQPGLRYYEIGSRMRHNYPLYVHGKEPADELANETGEYVWLMVEEQGWGYFLYKTGGSDAVESGAYTKGSRWHLNSPASGKVVLAHMDEERVNEILDMHGLKQMTPNTIMDREELLTELEIIRDQGFARDEEGSAIGINGVAAPVQGLDGMIGTISISGPASRINGEYFQETLPDKLTKTADIIRIRYNGDAAVQE